MNTILLAIILSALPYLGTTERVDVKPFILVELFTSEGCSSCPSADQLLSQIVNQKNEGAEVMGLSFHVDYWDYIGWKDPYANKQFTKRQRAYSDKLNLYQVYTPQMVVNGKYAFVGSDRNKWTELSASLLREKAQYSFQIDKVKVYDQTVGVVVSSESDEELLLNLAVVERGLSQSVKRGENRGRLLSHDNVVRVFDVQVFRGNAQATQLTLPDDLNMDKSSLIVYVQDPKTYEVIGAIERALIGLK